MISVEIPSENMCAPHPINEWTGRRYSLGYCSNEGFQKVTGAEKPMFRPRKQ